ncbi:MAG: radical SAM family heme chaperone HemW [Acidimicrobiales bacterium]
MYVHIPFCARRCDYCAFATWTDRHHLMSSYARACREAIGMAVDRGALVSATSVFFGGGTPSLMPAPLLCSILSAVPRSADAEVTVECHPDAASAELFAMYRSAGVTRISLGVQSSVAHVLSALGRDHRPDQVFQAVACIAEAGFPTWNLDLIFGAAGERMADWKRTLDDICGLDPPPPHVSAYALTVEPGTPLAGDPARHPDEDDQAEKYAVADERLGRAGLVSYEVSNWARPGHECRHNLLYWSQGDYLGIGCAAHSHVDGRRWWNVRSPERYIDSIGSGASAEAGSEVLPAPERTLEGLQLSLRTRSGVPAAALAADEEELSARGLLERAGNRLVLTLSGRLLANEVALRLRVGGGDVPRGGGIATWPKV